MLRTVAIAVSLLVALSLGAMAWIYVATDAGPRPAATAAPGPSAAASPEITQPALVALPPPAPAPAFAPPPEPSGMEPEEPALARYQPPRGSWESVAPVARAAALGPQGAAVGRDLIALQPQLTACFDEAAAARFGREQPTQTLDVERLEETGATVLMLQVETAPGRATIVDAPLEARGSASDGTIACAQRVLRGRTIRTPADGKPPARHRLLFNLHP